jgi:hypothetical protein
MAKNLIFMCGDQQYAFDVTKLDRSKLYGWKEVKAFDPDGFECQKIDIDDSGTFMIPSGGKAIATLDSNGNWVNKSDLVAIDKDGLEAQLVESSYSVPVQLQDTVTWEEFLNHSIEYVYVLNSEQATDALVANVKGLDGIYTFRYNYRTDYEASPAFIVESKDTLYMLIGTKLDFQYVGLDESGDVVSNDDEISVDDEIDFGMM